MSNSTAEPKPLLADRVDRRLLEVQRGVNKVRVGVALLRRMILADGPRARILKLADAVAGKRQAKVRGASDDGWGEGHDEWLVDVEDELREAAGQIAAVSWLSEADLGEAEDEDESRGEIESVEQASAEAGGGADDDDLAADQRHPHWLETELSDLQQIAGGIHGLVVHCGGENLVGVDPDQAAAVLAGDLARRLGRLAQECQDATLIDLGELQRLQEAAGNAAPKGGAR